MLRNKIISRIRTLIWKIEMGHNSKAILPDLKAILKKIKGDKEMSNYNEKL